MQIVKREKFKGLNDRDRAYKIPDGAAQSSMNFLAFRDRVELCRGTRLIGVELTGTGRITGLGVGVRPDGTEVLFRTRGQIIEYFDETSDVWTEIGTNQLGSDASGDDVSIEPYNTEAGAQVWIGTTESSLYKIMVANPGSITDVYNSATSYRGRFRIMRNSMYLFDYRDRGRDRYNLRRSYVDARAYTFVDNENIGTGNGSTRTFTATLAFKAAQTRRTCFGVSVTDGTETFTETGNGTLTGSLGGTGTINYTTGAVSVTFNTAPANLQAITCDHYWEDSSSTGIADFTSSATRTAGQGYTLMQGEGLRLTDVRNFHDNIFPFHERTIYRVVEAADDVDIQNRVFRRGTGIANPGATVATEEGIYYIDDADQDDPHFRLLTIEGDNVEIKPRSISKEDLELSTYRFDQGEAIQFGDFILFSCRRNTATWNDRVFIYNRVENTWNIRDWAISKFAVYNGILHGGSSISNNVFELFSAFDDENFIVEGNRVEKQDNLGTERLKKVKIFRMRGLIQPTQLVNLYLRTDGGNRGASIGTISGTGTYVDAGTDITIGTTVLGAREIGGGGSGETAHPYQYEVRIRTDLFREISLDVEIAPTGIGFFSYDTIEWVDVRVFGKKLPSAYRVAYT